MSENEDQPTSPEAQDAPGAAEDTAATPGARAASPAAQAASRARRIGGRPLPGPRTPADLDEPEARAARAARESTASRDAETATRARRPTGRRQPTRAAAPTAAADAEALRRRIHRVGIAYAVLAGLAAAAMLGVGIWLSHGVWWAKKSVSDERQKVRTQVLAAAKTCTVAILSYDYRHLDQSENAGKACATGQLLSDYTRLMDSTVKTIAPQSKTIQQFQVANAGVSSVSPDGKQWVILVYGQEAVTNTTTAGGSSSTPSSTPSAGGSASRSATPSAGRTATPSPSASATPSGSGSSSAPAGSPRLDISSELVTMTKVGNRWVASQMTSAS
jgi:hypothetical protein